MKSLGFVLTICFYFNLATADAQQISYETLAGNWEYASPIRKDKITYNLGLDKKFLGKTERNEKEIIAKGDYQIEKKGALDRLRLNLLVEGTKTHVNYYFVKFISADSLKVQPVNAKEAKWKEETQKNTMTFTRIKDKPKEKDSTSKSGPF